MLKIILLLCVTSVVQPSAVSTVKEECYRVISYYNDSAICRIDNGMGYILFDTDKSARYSLVIYHKNIAIAQFHLVSTKQYSGLSEIDGYVFYSRLVGRDRSEERFSSFNNDAIQVRTSVDRAKTRKLTNKITKNIRKKWLYYKKIGKLSKDGSGVFHELRNKYLPVFAFALIPM